jgi:hypothetical protein
LLFRQLHALPPHGSAKLTVLGKNTVSFYESQDEKMQVLRKEAKELAEKR